MQKTNLKTLLSLAVVSLALGACKPAEKKATEVFSMDDVVPMKLKGNVKEIIFITTPDNYTTYKFDKDGHMQSFILKNDNFSTVENEASTDSPYISISLLQNAVFTYHYDQDSKLNHIDQFTSSVVTTLSAKSKKEYFKDTTRLYFNPLGQLTKSSMSPNEEIGAEKTYKYDKQGRIITIMDYTRFVKTEPDKYLLNYDKQGRIKEYTAAGGTIAPTKFTIKYTAYDSHGNWIKRIMRRESTEPLGQRTINYLTTRKITYY